MNEQKPFEAMNNEEKIIDTLRKMNMTFMNIKEELKDIKLIMKETAEKKE
jgi:hypothetical protein